MINLPNNKVKNSYFTKIFQLNCGGRLLSIDKPIVMGILNITPDSFFDGGKYQDTPNILARTQQIIDEGAEIIDIG
ncbi:MAG: dihydropteroate synthase, partial [Bacteroidales bacterium]|nr:dihydropteroate synthase [Bacteroidales bacterium]